MASLSKARHEQDYGALESGRGDEKEPLLDRKGHNNVDYTWSAIIKAFLFPAIGGLLFGYDVGATSGAVVSLTSPQLSGVSWYDSSSIQNSLVVSGSLFGALPGSILAFSVADSLGRRRELIVASFAYGLGALASAFANSLPFLVLGRLVYGIGIGLAMHAGPLYVSETAPSQIRGTMVSMQEAFTVIGILTGYVVSSLAINSVAGWRIMYAIAAPIAVILWVGMWCLQPSPRWVLLQAVRGKGSLDDAKTRVEPMIQRLRGKKVSKQKIEDEWNETVDSAKGGGEQITLGELFRGKLNQKAFIIGGGLVFLQQMTGQPSVLYYAAGILQSAGFSSASDATRVSVYLGIWKLFPTLVSTSLVDKVGRRPLLITGLTAIFLSLLGLAGFYSIFSGISWLAVASLLVYVGAYQLSFGPISWVMVSEVFPLHSRGRAASLTTFINFGTSAVVTFAFSPLQEAVGASVTFLMFAVVGLFALLFAITIVPETKGLTLEEIAAKLSR